MQATASRTSHRFDTIKLSLLAAALVVVAIASVTAYAIRSDSTATTAPAVNPVTTRMPAWRFAEINELPTTAARPQHRFEDWRFREINQLPTSAAISQFSFEAQHFIEINLLPGNDGALVAPDMANGTRS